METHSNKDQAINFIKNAVIGCLILTCLALTLVYSSQKSVNETKEIYNNYLNSKIKTLEKENKKLEKQIIDLKQ